MLRLKADLGKFARFCDLFSQKSRRFSLTLLKK
jgi:hypothetical protein